MELTSSAADDPRPPDVTELEAALARFAEFTELMSEGPLGLHPENEYGSEYPVDEENDLERPSSLWLAGV